MSAVIAESGDQLTNGSSSKAKNRRFSLTSRNDTEFEAMWGISKIEEEGLLVKFRQNIEGATGETLSPRYDEFYLRRFLRARQHDLEKGQEMFLNHLKWRREFGTDTILQDFVYEERESFLALYPQGYHKVDKLGRPIYIQHLGQINMKAMKNVTTEDRMIRFHVQEYERALKYIFPACSKVRGMHISQTLAIMDLKGVGLRHLSGDVKRILSEITTIDQNNYPETLGKTLIINAPTVFRAIWAIVKPMLDPRTLAKIEVCPSDYLPILKKWIDVENIPAYLGGKSSGSLIDDIGPWNDVEMIEEIDRESYMSHRESGLSRASSQAYLSAEEDDSLLDEGLSPLDQVPILERVKGLEEQIPGLEAGMSFDRYDKPSRLIGQGTLLSRVEALEKAISILMETQDSYMVAKKYSQAVTKKSGCCTIM